MEYIVLDHCTISSDDGSFPEDITDGLVTANGDKVSIRRYETDRSGATKPVFIDALFDAVMDQARTGGAVAFTGKSRRLIDDVGLVPDDAVITIKVKKWRGSNR